MNIESVSVRKMKVNMNPLRRNYYLLRSQHFQQQQVQGAIQ